MNELVGTIAAIWIGSMFAYAGSLKLVAPVESRVRTIQEYKVVPDAVARSVAVALPYLELTIGGVILLTPLMTVGLAAAAILGAMFVVATGSVLVRRLEVDCGCAGARSGRVGVSSLLRAILIVAAAVAATATGSPVHLAIGSIVLGLALVPGAIVVLRRRRVQVQGPQPAAAPHHHHHHHHSPVPMQQ